jgi:hypothetical protein
VVADAGTLGGGIESSLLTFGCPTLALEELLFQEKLSFLRNDLPIDDGVGGSSGLEGRTGDLASDGRGLDTGAGSFRGDVRSSGGLLSRPPSDGFLDKAASRRPLLGTEDEENGVRPDLSASRVDGSLVDSDELVISPTVGLSRRS